MSGAEHLLLQHFGEADDGVERRPQLVRHRGQELGLVPAGRLQVAVQAAQLVVHAVEVGGQRAELVPVGHLDVAGEVAGGQLVEAPLHLRDGPDDRPGDGEAEEEGEADAAGGDGDEGPAGVPA